MLEVVEFTLQSEEGVGVEMGADSTASLDFFFRGLGVGTQQIFDHGLVGITILDHVTVNFLPSAVFEIAAVLTIYTDSDGPDLICCDFHGSLLVIHYVYCMPKAANCQPLECQM